MTAPQVELEVILRFGTRTRRVPLAAIAAITHKPTATLRDALSRLLFTLLDRNAEAEACGALGDQTEGNDPNVGPDVNVHEVKHRNVDVNVGTRAHVTAPADEPLSAERLATELQDRHSLPYFRQLLLQEPHELVAAALVETIARRAEIRGRPGAYFIGVMRALKRARYPHLHPYVRTSPDSS